MSRTSDFSASDGVGCFDDHRSLANINIIKLANAGIQPTSSSIAKKKRLKSKFTIESQQNLQKARPPNLYGISSQKKLKSLLSGQSP